MKCNALLDIDIPSVGREFYGQESRADTLMSTCTVMSIMGSVSCVMACFILHSNSVFT